MFTGKELGWHIPWKQGVLFPKDEHQNQLKTSLDKQLIRF